MSNSDLNTSLKYENINLQEDLLFYKSQNIYFLGKIQDLEDEMRVLKEKLMKLTAIEEGYQLNYQPGPHFPENL